MKIPALLQNLLIALTFVWLLRKTTPLAIGGDEFCISFYGILLCILSLLIVFFAAFNRRRVLNYARFGVCVCLVFYFSCYQLSERCIHFSSSFPNIVRSIAVIEEYCFSKDRSVIFIQNVKAECIRQATRSSEIADSTSALTFLRLAQEFEKIANYRSTYEIDRDFAVSCFNLGFVREGHYWIHKAENEYRQEIEDTNISFVAHIQYHLKNQPDKLTSSFKHLPQDLRDCITNGDSKLLVSIPNLEKVISE